MNEQDEEALVARMTRELEARPHFVFPIRIDAGSLFTMIAAVQLALRHPECTGRKARRLEEIVGGMIEGIRQQGFPAMAELLEAGNDWDNDTVSGEDEDDEDLEGRGDVRL